MVCSSNQNVLNLLMMKCGAVVLFLIHSLYCIFNHLTSYFCNTLHSLKSLYFRTNKSRHISVALLKEELKCYPKIPKHLVIIIEEEDISYQDCVKLILWCINSGIPYISFYNHSSGINPTSLYEVLCKRSKSSLQSIKWGKSFHESVKEMARKDINGYVWSPVVEVNLFSSKSVHEIMENVMNTFCRQGVNPGDITVDTVDQRFREELLLPDPCLGLVFAPTLSTFGFMPWQIRVTEFSHMSTHHNLQLEDFLESLKSFAFCQQRFGK